MTGILIVDKPVDWTSFDVVNKIRGTLKAYAGQGRLKVGHGGTLDPMATGVLPVFIGREYTKRVLECESADKEYTAGLKLGVVTDTQDITGTVLSQTGGVSVTRTELEFALDTVRGEIKQTPPMYSALKVNGQRLYAIARRGGEVEREPRNITVYNADIIGGAGGEWTIRFTVSKGTYVRTLCHDIGAALGFGGVMSYLRRTRVGTFHETNAVSVEKAVDMIKNGTLSEKLIKDIGNK